MSHTCLIQNSTIFGYLKGYFSLDSQSMHLVAFWNNCLNLPNNGCYQWESPWVASLSGSCFGMHHIGGPPKPSAMERRTTNEKRQESSMIHSASPTVQLVSRILFTWNSFSFPRFEKMWKDLRTGMCWHYQYYSPWFWNGRVDQKNVTQQRIALYGRLLTMDGWSAVKLKYYLYYKRADTIQRGWP